ncbi:50S ribosomal protein L33 [Candidatus Azambacteria bacterium RIFCSPLOWO2_01_FULL_37_9]|uniref:Large ribosomal subunit protein bL33 n=1 Tax=Candidatus Azambacteria bacterium RIFCSPLOWO2_01_FULL_37_9 TaxID=1797297 RepID=A0A1F5C9E5_9BACT|nr:MAG: 50S ribosomal protein L33 [Candidatus Azambacteria bacterium RIFCSPLOWO2_01_FULL_37_9]
MPQPHIAKMQCPVCKEINYWTTRNKKAVQNKLEFSKYCKKCRKHTAHKEGKK